MERSPARPGAPRSARGAAIALLALGIAASADVPQVRAKDCGGAIECACGDRVVVSTTLTKDLNGCRGRGLDVVAGVLDCAGHQISGPGDRVLGEGINLDSAVGAAVLSCAVRNFRRGILVDGGSDNLIRQCDVFNNNVGIWVGDGALRTEIRQNTVHDNRDEGVHLGGGTSGALVKDNEIIANRVENLYLIATSGNRVINNLMDQSTEASVLLKHANDNFFAKNVVAKRNINVRGDSSGNVFEKNQIHNGRFTFLAIEEDKRGWTYPHGNTVSAGRVLQASTCFMFIGAYDNTAVGVLANNCRAMQEKEAGDVVPYGNSVTLNYIGGGPGGGGGGDGGGGEPSDALLPKGSIKFDDPGLGRDTLKMRGYLLSETPLEALAEDVSIRLEDSDGVTLEVFVPAGTLRESGRSAEYEHGEDGRLPGVEAIEIRRESVGSWSFRFVATTDLSTANEAAMTLTWRVGASVFVFPDTWTQTAEGWRLR